MAWLVTARKSVLCQVTWRHQLRNDRPVSSSQPLPPPTRYIKMTRYPSITSVSINDLKIQYGADFFYAAFARFVVLQQNPQMTHAHLEQESLDVHIPFHSVSVYHYVQYQDDDVTEDVLASIPARLY